GRTDYGRLVSCECQRVVLEEQRRKDLMNWCRLPVGTEHMTLEKTEKKPWIKTALAAASQIADEIGDIKWLTLIAPKDRGKTHLAIAICRRWLERGRPARYAFVPLMLKELRDGFEREGEESYRNAFDRLCNFPLLVLDDMGVEKESEWSQEQLQTIIHYRGINGLPLVVTTNHPLNELKNDPEGRIASRLQRETWCKVIVLGGQEHRLER
ncbi:MAG: ATP-binding protein, partial [Dehalococcoidia bacterium]